MNRDMIFWQFSRQNVEAADFTNFLRDYAPPVLAAAGPGYGLVGGRLDYVAGRSVAALVYRHERHVIDLFVWPEPGAASPIRITSRQGFAVAHWREAAMTYWAVSDLNAGDLRDFCDRLRAEATP